MYVESLRRVQVYNKSLFYGSFEQKPKIPSNITSVLSEAYSDCYKYRFDLNVLRTYALSPKGILRIFVYRAIYKNSPLLRIHQIYKYSNTYVR